MNDQALWSIAQALHNIATCLGYVASLCGLVFAITLTYVTLLVMHGLTSK